MVAPDLINVEVLSAFRRLVHHGVVTVHRAEQGVADLRVAPLLRLPTLSLLDASWLLRANLSMYDACYVALAAALVCPLISGDERLARAPRLPVHVIVP
jgi:predicted nucleic acid-binding protein